MRTQPKIGFGLERIGLACANWPRTSGVLLLIAFLVSLYGTSLVRMEDQVSELFRSDRVEFQKFDNVRKLFRESENDIAILIEAPDVLTREALEAARNVHLDSLLIDGVASALSMFSMYETPDANGDADPLFPEPLPQGAAFEDLRARLLVNPVVAGRMFSSDLSHVLIVLALDPTVERPMGELIEEIRNTAEEIVEPLGYNVYLGGVPVLRDFVTTAIARDRIMFNIIGFIVGLVVSYLFLRSVRYTAVAAAPPLSAVVFSLGLMGFGGISLNPLSVVLPPLVMVLAFADSLHLVFAARRALARGMSGQQAAIHAVRSVGPACVLTSLTTAIALATITIASSELIASFGLVASLGAVMAFFAVIMVTPTLIALLLKPGETARLEKAPWIMWLSRNCGAVADWSGNNARVVSLLGALVIGAGLWATWTLKPHYQLSAYLPDDAVVRTTTERMDRLFGGAFDMLAVVRWEGQDTAALMTMVEAVRDVHNVIESNPSISNTWSIEALRRWIAPGTEQGGEMQLANFIAGLPRHWLDRLLSPSENAALIGGRIPDLESAEIRDIADWVEARAKTAVAPYPGVSVEITGITTLSARESAPMIRQLAIGLVSAIFIVMVLLAVSFRSIWAALYSLLPNLLPLVLGGTALAVMGVGLRYETVIALTLAFGIAVDDTIHFLYHVGRGGWREARTRATVLATAQRIGPVLAVTTIVLAIGMAVTLISALPSIRGFGGMAIVVLVLALVADLVLLPAILRLRDNSRSTSRPEEEILSTVQS